MASVGSNEMPCPRNWFRVAEEVPSVSHWTGSRHWLSSFPMSVMSWVKGAPGSGLEHWIDQDGPSMAVRPSIAPTMGCP